VALIARHVRSARESGHHYRSDRGWFWGQKRYHPTLKLKKDHFAHVLLHAPDLITYHPKSPDVPHLRPCFSGAGIAIDLA
jgi:hypothetical protein